MDFTNAPSISSHQEEANLCTKYRIFLSILLVINAMAFALITAFTYKFIKVFRLTKKLQFMFILLVCFASLGRIIFFIIELAYRNGNWNIPPPTWVEASIHWMNSALLTSAVITNIFSWLYQTLRLDKLLTGNRRNQLGYHIALAVTLTLEVLVLVGLVLLTCVIYGEDPILVTIFAVFYSMTFIIVAFAFATVGIIFYWKFKKVSPEHAKQKRNRVMLSIFIIFTTFMIRGINNLVNSLNGTEGSLTLRWLDDDYILYNILWMFYAIIVDAVPSIYLSYSIYLVTQEYRNRYLSQNSMRGSSKQRKFSFEESSFKEDSLVEKTDNLEDTNDSLTESWKNEVATFDRENIN